MPITVPQTIRKAWGDEVVAEFVPWLDETVQEAIQEKAVARDEYRQVLSRLDVLDKSVSLINDQLMQTRAEFREGQAGMRIEFREEMAGMRTEFRDDMAQMRTEFREEMAQMRTEFHQGLGELRRDMNERFDGMYHRMLIQSRWLVGSIVLFGTVITILLAIGQFIK